MIIRRPLLTLVAAFLLAASVSHRGTAAGPFETKLTPDQQILHALNRLTFGPRPGEVDEVRRIGVEKWMELQLHPERIPESPALEAKLKPLDTLHMDPAEIVQEYFQNPAMMRMAPVVNGLKRSDAGAAAQGNERHGRGAQSGDSGARPGKALASAGHGSTQRSGGFARRVAAGSHGREKETSGRAHAGTAQTASAAARFADARTDSNRPAWHEGTA